MLPLSSGRWQSQTSVWYTHKVITVTHFTSDTNFSSVTCCLKAIFLGFSLVLIKNVWRYGGVTQWYLNNSGLGNYIIKSFINLNKS